MKREEFNTNDIKLPELIFDLDFETATITSITDKVSGTKLKSSANTNTCEIVTHNYFGKGVKFKTRSSENVFSAAYNETSFPKLYGMFNDVNTPFSVFGLVDTSEASSSERWGLLSIYNIDRFIGYTSDSSKMNIYTNMSNNLYGIGTRFVTVKDNIKLMFAGEDSLKSYYYDSNSNYIENTSTYRSNTVSGTGTLKFGCSQETGYYVISGVTIYKLKVFAGILNEEQINYLIWK